jgi:exodeoxyribonuclease III
MFKIATWNVNSLRVRLPQVLDWVAKHKPDVLALQETKVTDDKFPGLEIEAAGYKVVYSGQKTYNGVAVLSREKACDIVTDLPGIDDPQRRVLGVTVGDLRILNLYVPNGSEVDSDKYKYKLDWLEKLQAYVKQQLSVYPKLIVLGDFNIAPDDRDVYDPKVWAGHILVSEPEREALRKLLKVGLTDSFRLFNDEAGHYSWWDYRMAAFPRDRGLRLDLILVSEVLVKQVKKVVIDKEPRGLDRPSDHTPVVIEF